ncbi:MAG: PA14 domain-containing protein [Planctomycetota bacterium]
MTSPLIEGASNLTTFWIAIAIACVCMNLPSAAQDKGRPGLVFVFFNSNELQRPGQCGVEQQINAELKGTSCSGLWMGQIYFPATGEVAFDAEADRGVRLFLGGKAVIDGWSPDDARRGAVRVEAGQSMPFRLEYSHMGGASYMRLYWSWQGHPRELVPASAFSHESADFRHAQAILGGRESVAPGNQGPAPSPDTAVRFAPVGDEAVKASLYEPAREGSPKPKEPIRLRSGPHLFLDDYLVESSRNVARGVNRPVRDPRIPNPIVTGKEDRNFQPFLTVLRDPKTMRFRMWYGIWKESKDIGSSHIGYMESEDGIHWIRPVRVLDDPAPIQFGNSVLDEGPDFPDPSKRYKLGWWKDGGLKIAVSPDGLNWTSLASYVVLRHNHDITNIFRDTLRNRYVATISVFTTSPLWNGMRRATMQSVSQDLLCWQTPWCVLAPVESVDEGQTQFYAMNGHIIRGDLWIGLVKVLRDDLRASGSPEASFGIGYTTLAWTRDGERWVRDREPFFKPDPAEGAWDHAHAWMDCQLLVDDEVYIYYGGYKNGHKVNRFEERQIGLVRMPRDRYVSRDAGKEQGTLRTPPVILDATCMTVNANVQGEFRVRILDEGGKPLTGYDFPDCAPIRGDSVSHPVHWKGGPVLPRAKPVRVEFLLNNARLYGFDL